MSEARIKVSAQDDASRVFADIRSSIDQASRSATALGEALGITAGLSLAGFAALAKSTIDSLDALNDLKDATGSSIENISALEDVAARTGTSFDTVSTALIKFNGQLKDAKPGSGAEQALTAIGLSVKDLQSLDPAEALLKVSVALGGFAEDASKARLVQELFGKSIGAVAPLLNDLAEKGKLNATVTTEQVKAAEAFNQQLFQMAKNSEDASRALVSSLLPAINDGIERFKLAYKNSGGFLETLALYNRLDYSKDIQGNLQVVEQQIAALEDRSKRITSDSVQKGNDKAIEDLKKQATYLKELRQLKILAEQGENSDAVTRKFQQKKSIGNFQKDKPQAVKGPAKDPITDNQKSLASYVNNLQQRIDALDELTESQKTLNYLQSLGAEGENAQVRELLLGLAATYEAKEKLKETTKRLNELDKVNTGYLDGLAKEVLATEQSNQKLREYLEEIGLSKKELDALTLARLDATIATEEGNLALARSTGGIEEEVSAMEKKLELLKQTRNLTAQGQVKQAAADTKADQDKASKEFADTLHNDLKGAFSAAFRDTKDPLSAFGNALSDVIYSRASTALVEALSDKAFNSLFSGSGDTLGSFVSAIFGGAPGKAVGGPVSAGGLYQVNERGPELLNIGSKQFLMMGGQDGTITPNGGQSAPSAGNTVIVNVHQTFAPGTSRATTLQAASDARRQLELAGRNL